MVWMSSKTVNYSGKILSLVTDRLRKVCRLSFGFGNHNITTNYSHKNVYVTAFL